VTSFLTLLVGALIVAAGLVTVTRRNPIHAALSMLVALGGIGLLFLGLRSPFLAAMQVLLYGGAIMVLFTFVIMLLTLHDDEMGPEPPANVKMLGAAGSFGVLAIVWHALSTRGGGTHFRMPHVPWGPAEAYGTAEHFARFLYTDYVVAFELVTVLVMAGVAGVIALARRPGSETLEGTKLAGHAEPEPAPHAAPEVHP
jgi:NADH-quinone oxidoreductase subunit J